MYELASVGELPLPQPSPPFSNKRERDEDTPPLDNSPSPPAAGDMHDGPRPMIGSKRVSRATSQFEGGGISHRHLPVYSDELGRLPLHGQVKFVSGQPPAGAHQNQQHIANQQTMADQSGYWPMPSMSQMPQQQFMQPQLDQRLSQGMGASSLAYNQMVSQSTIMNTPQHPSNMMPRPMQNQAIPPSNMAVDPLLGGTGYTGKDVQGVQTIMDANAALPPIDFDAMAMWSNAPTGFE